MKLKTVAQVTNDLNAIAKQHGKSGFDVAKAAYMKSVTVTNDEGDVLSPDQYNIEVEIADDAPVTKAASADPATDINAIVKNAIASALADRGGVAVTKSSHITMADSRGRSTPRGVSKMFKDIDGISGSKRAHALGRWIQAVTFGQRAPDAVKFCRENGYPIVYGDFKDANSDEFVTKSITGHSEAVNADGGFLVPTEFDPTNMVWLRESYGVFRQYANVRNMSSDRIEWLRKNSQHTAYFNGEGATNTTSKMGFTRLGMTAKKLRTDGYLTQELSDDAAINVGDEAARDIVETFALKEDQCGFNGDGTSTYGGIVGLTKSFLNLGTVSNSIGIYDSNASSTGATYDAITLAGIMAWRAKLPAYADNARTRIFCHKTFYHAALERLAANAGGSTLVDIGTGMSTPMFMGTPVVFCQALPASLTADTPDAFYGDLSLAADFGTRKGITFKTTDVGGNAWENDEIAYKATERFDINVHDVGNNTSTAADQKAGPLVALIVG